MTNNEIDSLTASITDINVKDKEKHLSFEGRGMKLDSAEDAQKVVDEIEAALPISVLTFKGNTINIAAAEKISASLAKCHSLKRALWSDMFTGRSKTESPPALKLMCNALTTAKVTLTELDLSDNAFGPTGADSIKALLESSCAYTLEILRLNNDGLGIGGGKIIATSLVSCWASSNKMGKPLKLKVFVAGRNRLENNGATALAEAFKTIGSLEEITLPQNGIYYDGIVALADSFSYNPNLQRLNLADNTLVCQGAIAIAKVLPSLVHLKSLNLNDCLLRSSGTIKLAKAIKYNCNELEELLIGGNEVNTKAALEMGEAVFAKASLETVDFGGNSIGNRGIEDLKALFKDHGVLEKLILSSEDEGTCSEAEELEEDEDVEEVYDEEKDEEDEDQLFALVDEFLETFDPGVLSELADDAPSLIAAHVKDDLINPYFAVHILLRISSLITKTCHAQIRELAYLTCKSILALCEFRVFVDILCQKLGLIKNEKGRIQKPKNLYGILYVLKQECSETYFDPVKNVLRFLAAKRINNTMDPMEKELWTDFCSD